MPGAEASRGQRGTALEHDAESTDQAFLALLGAEGKLGRIDSNDVSALYAELRAIAAVYFRDQAPGHTLQPTALVHEALANMIRSQSNGVASREHFLGIAAKAMRRILIDHARRKRADKRGGDAARITLSGEMLADDGGAYDALDLDDALRKLEAVDGRQARVVELRFFGGLGYEQIAEVVGVSKRTVEIDWRMAKAWLRRELGSGTRA